MMLDDPKRPVDPSQLIRIPRSEWEDIKRRVKKLEELVGSIGELAEHPVIADIK